MKSRYQLLLVAWVIAFCGCVGFRDRMADCDQSRAAIKADLGTDSTVSFQEFHGTGGKKLLVNVKLAATPPGDAVAVKAKVESIVRAHFRVAVDQVNVTF